MTTRTHTSETNDIADTTFGTIQNLLDQVIDRTPITLDDPNLKAIERLRLLPDGQVLEVSYCYGRMTDGNLRRVNLDRNLFTRRGHRRELVALAKTTGRFIPGLLDNISIL